ncbi:MAG: AAA family ATPase [Proteobacteria bacterium]|nr:AAA family ATPase [Pseudomonadota bacterium]
MRLNRLDLTRFGIFTDQVIDFGCGIAGQPDLHIVYGPNEAGKSTALAAFLDLLFGIEFRTRYNFRHDNRTMRIGATLALNAGVHQLVRVKSQQNSLLDAAGQPVSDAVLRGDLGSIDRESYRAMFSLDDDILESGGEDIIASKGDVGQLLYAASAGVTDLSRSIAAVKEAADRFYRQGTRGHELYALKQQLGTLKAERESIDMLASDYARLMAERKLLQERYEAALADRAAVQSRQVEIQRLLAAQPRLAALRRLRADLAPLADLPDAPSQWWADLPSLRDDEIQLATKVAIQAEDLAGLTTARDAITIDQAALAAAGSIDALSELRARHRTAETDIPLRRVELQTADRAIEAILNRIDRPDIATPEDLVIAAGPLSALTDLIEARSGIEADLTAARIEHETAARDRAEAIADLDRCGGSPAQDDARLARFDAAIVTVQASDHAARRRLAEQAHAELIEAVAHRLRDLRPWVGDIAALLAMVVPASGEIERLRRILATAEAEVRTDAAELERLTGAHRRRAAQLHVLGTIPGVVPDVAVSQSRAARDAAWAAHRRALDPASADAFEAALHEDDAMIRERHAHIAEVAKRREAELDLAGLTADRQHAIERHHHARTALTAIQTEIAAAIQRQTPGVPADTTIEQWEAWLQRRASAVEAWDRACAQRRLAAAAEADGDAARRRMIAAFDAAGIPHDNTAGLDDLLAAARTVIDQETTVKSLRHAVRKAETAFAERQRRAEDAEQRDATWQADWAAASAACWLGAGGAVPALAEVRAILASLADLPAALEKRAGLRARIAAMQQDQAAFAARIAAVATALDVPHEARATLETAAAIDARIKTAQQAESDHAKLAREHDAAQRQQRQLQRALDDHHRRKAALTGHFRVATLDEVTLMLDRLKTRADLRAQADQNGTEILDLLGLATLEAAEAALDQADRDALAAEQSTLAARFDACDQQTRTLSTACTIAHDKVAAIGGDDAVARIESRRRTIHLEIDAKATDYLRLRIGVAAAEQALRLYRDHHRSSMMQNASAAFATISRGAYARLDTQVGKDQEVLVAIGADGSSKLAAELSKGTRFQLYLALRVAGHREFARTRPSLPFIADDIMETFDDFRAEETFRLFAGMAGIGQVIYLTHHRHLIDIARRICPTVRVHELA